MRCAERASRMKPSCTRSSAAFRSSTKRRTRRTSDAPSWRNSSATSRSTSSEPARASDDVRRDRDGVGHEHRATHHNWSGHRAYRRAIAGNRVTSRPQRVCDHTAQGVVTRDVDAPPLPPIHVAPCSHGPALGFLHRVFAARCHPRAPPAQSVVSSALSVLDRGPTKGEGTTNGSTSIWIGDETTATWCAAWRGYRGRAVGAGRPGCVGWRGSDAG